MLGNLGLELHLQIMRHKTLVVMSSLSGLSVIAETLNKCSLLKRNKLWLRVNSGFQSSEYPHGKGLLGLVGGTQAPGHGLQGALTELSNKLS